MMLRHAPVIQMPDVATRIVKPAAEQFSNILPGFCPRPSFGIPRIFAPNFINQITNAFFIFEQAKKSRVNSFKGFLQLTERIISRSLPARFNRQEICFAISVKSYRAIQCLQLSVFPFVIV
ncbi:Uncharacterised protein [Klebsiella michiganensis]|nr:Uncharacterised protein [Klebsiella michiganensis]